MIDYRHNNFDLTLFNRDVRRDVRNCAISLFIFYGINLGVTTIIEGVIVASGMLQAASSAGGVYHDPSEFLDEKTLAILAIVGIIAGSVIFMNRRKARFFTDVALPSAEKMKPWIFSILVIVTQGIQCATVLITTLIESLLPESVSIYDSYGSAMDALLTPYGMIYVVLVGPIIEELIFRGAVMGPLRKYGDNFAILFSSLLFGLYHGMFLQMPFAFAMGLVLGYASTRWSLRTSIALHIISNGLAVVLSEEAFATPGILFLFACGILTIILFLSFRPRLKERIRAGAPYYGRVTYAYGFSSIAFWLFTAAMIGYAFLQLILLGSY